MPTRITTLSSAGLAMTSPSQNPVEITTSGGVVTDDPFALSGGAGVFWVINNLGTLRAAGAGGVGITLASGGTVDNGGPKGGSASIRGAQTGVLIAGGRGSVVNTGTIAGVAGAGISLAAGGTVRNGSAAAASASIGGATAISAGGAAATVVNYGRIGSFGRAAIALQAGGTVINGSAGVTAATIIGSVLLEGAGRVANYGTLQGAVGDYSHGRGDFGTILNAGVMRGSIHGYFIASGGGRFTVENSGMLFGAVNIYGYALGQTVTNTGTIRNGVSLAGDLTTEVVRNDGLIVAGVQLSGYGASRAGLTNTGTIVAALRPGVAANDAAIIRNGASLGSSALIVGSIGVTLQSSGAEALVNFGTVVGLSGTAALLGGSTNRLIVEPGSAFAGRVIAEGSAAVNTIELAPGSGTIVNLGRSFVGFGGLQVDPGGVWTLTGTDTLPAGTSIALGPKARLVVEGTLQTGGDISLNGSGSLGVNTAGAIEIGNTGRVGGGTIGIDAGRTLSGSGTLGGRLIVTGAVVASGGTLEIGGNATGIGSAGIDPGAVLRIDGGMHLAGLRFVGASKGAPETAVLARPPLFGATVSGFDVAGATTIDLGGIAATAAHAVGHELFLAGAGGRVATLAFASSYTSAHFHLASDQHGGTRLTFA